MSQLPDTYKKPSEWESDFSALSRDEEYEGQSIWFLNAFWEDMDEKDREKIWEITQDFIGMDPYHRNGHELSEFTAMKLLAKHGTPMTRSEMRSIFKEIDIDFNGSISLLEYLVWRYQVTLEDVMSRPQGYTEAIQKCLEKKRGIKRQLSIVTKSKEKTESMSKTSVIHKHGLVALKTQEEGLKEQLFWANRQMRGIMNRQGGEGLGMGAKWYREREEKEKEKYRGAQGTFGRGRSSSYVQRMIRQLNIRAGTI